MAFDRVPQPGPKTGELNHARGPKGEKRSAGRVAAFALGSFWACSRNHLAGILKSYALSGTSNYIRRVKLICLETSTGEPMTIELRELYSSPNGDRWYLARDVDLGQVFIRHEPNLPSGGKAENIEVAAFLSQSGQGPEHRELLRLIGTLAKRDHSSAEGTAARIKSHAKSYIVELTDGSKWRIWPGDLATTLGWTPDAEIETLPIEDEFCSHVLVDQSHGSTVRAIEASNDWPVEKLRKYLRRG